MSHLQFSRAILSHECATKSRDKVASVSVQHSVNRVAQIEQSSILKYSCATVKNSRDKLREKIAGVTSVLGAMYALHLSLVGLQLVVDFLFVIIELFRYLLRLRRYI